MGQPEVITFDKGLITKRSPLLLDEGELVEARGMSYDNPGVIEARTSKQAVGTTFTTAFPPAQSDTYVKATTYHVAPYWPYFATDPTKSLLGGATGSAWISASGNNTNQRFHIDLGSAKIVKQLYYENYHNNGSGTEYGVKNFTLWGSNNAAAFAELTYAIDTNWTQLTTSQAEFDRHISSDTVDPKYITVSNTVAYRYYALKFADNWGGLLLMCLRRIELKTDPLDQYGTINGMHRNVNTVLLTDAGRVRYKWDLNGYCGLYTPANENFTLVGYLANTNRPSFCDYEEFTFMVDGNAKKVFVGQNLYDWDIPAPASAPTGAAGAAGNPSGTYSLYVTYLIYFPNGYAVETAPSPAGTVTVTAQVISWSNIPKCPYTGPGITVHRKLFRYSTGLIEKYYVATIGDNTTTTYTDDFTDAQLELKSILDTEDYIIPPENVTCIVPHLLRVFALAANYAYPSEPYYPFNFKNTEALQVTSLGDDLVGGVEWGDQLFIASKSKWYRLAGNNSDTWQIKTTFAHAGSINRDTIKATRYGIFSQWYDGIYLFDGNVSKNLTGSKIDGALFTGIPSISSCYAEWDGRKYYFHYPESGTTISKRLVLDMGSYPDVIIYEEDFVPTAHSYHEPTGINYYGYDGYQYKEGGADAVSLSVKSGDRAVKNILQQKQIEYLYYDINTGGKDVVISVYVDDALAKSETVNTRVRTRERLLLPNSQGYRFSVAVSAADARGVTIYEPWAVSVNVTGV